MNQASGACQKKRDNTERKSTSKFSLRTGMETGKAVLPGVRHNTEPAQQEGQFARQWLAYPRRGTSVRPRDAERKPGAGRLTSVRR